MKELKVDDRTYMTYTGKFVYIMKDEKCLDALNIEELRNILVMMEEQQVIQAAEEVEDEA